MGFKDAQIGAYFEISPVVSPRLAVFPGDIHYSREAAFSFKKGDHLELSAIKTTLHIGAHADAPSHYQAEGESIERRAIDYYIGPCQVVSVELPRGRRILAKDLTEKHISAPRVLLKTRSFPNPEQWNKDFNALSGEAVRYLSSRGVTLVGIDTPSVDLSEDKELEAHKAIFAANMAILEGLVLEDVPDGFYTLVALPLRLEGAEASPVRAVLFPTSKDRA